MKKCLLELAESSHEQTVDFEDDNSPFRIDRLSCIETESISSVEVSWWVTQDVIEVV